MERLRDRDGSLANTQFEGGEVEDEYRCDVVRSRGDWATWYWHGHWLYITESEYLPLRLMYVTCSRYPRRICYETISSNGGASMER